MVVETFTAKVVWDEKYFLGYCVLWRREEAEGIGRKHQRYAERIDPELSTSNDPWHGYIMPQAGPDTGAMPSRERESDEVEVRVPGGQERLALVARLRASGEVAPRASNPQFIYTLSGRGTPESALHPARDDRWGDEPPDVVRSAEHRQRALEFVRHARDELQGAVESEELTGVERGVVVELALPGLDLVSDALVLDEALVTQWVTKGETLSEGIGLVRIALTLLAYAHQIPLFAELLQKVLELLGAG